MKKYYRVRDMLVCLVFLSSFFFLPSVLAGNCSLIGLPNPVITPTAPYQLNAPTPYADGAPVTVSGACASVESKFVYLIVLAYPTGLTGITANGHDYVNDSEQTGVYSNARVNVNGQYAYGDNVGGFLTIPMTDITGSEGNYYGNVSFTFTPATSVIVKSILPWPPYSMANPTAYLDLCPTSNMNDGGCSGGSIQAGNVPPSPANCSINNGTSVNVQFPSAMANEFNQVGAPVTRLRKQVSVSVTCSGLPDQNMAASFVADTNGFDTSSIATTDDNIGIQLTDASQQLIIPNTGRISVPIVSGNGTLNFFVTPIATTDKLPSLGGYTAHSVIEIVIP